MKTLILFIFLGATSLSLTQALAQDAKSPPFDAMQGKGMQEMMKHMQGIQVCMAGVDQAELQKIAGRAQSTQENIKALCAKGDSAQAEKVAIAFAQELQTSKDAEQARKCLEDLPEMMKGHMKGADMAQLKDQFTKKNICELAE